MSARMVGTILPTKAALARADRFADAQRRAAIELADEELGGFCWKQVVDGEVRYYEHPRMYYLPVKDRYGNYLRFERREDGHWYAFTLAVSQ